MGNFRATSIFFREHFPLLEFFLGQCGNIFWEYSARMNFFIRFSLAQIYFYDASPTPPPPLNNFSNGGTSWKLRDGGAICFYLSLARNLWRII